MKILITILLLLSTTLAVGCKGYTSAIHCDKCYGRGIELDDETFYKPYEERVYLPCPNKCPLKSPYKVQVSSGVYHWEIIPIGDGTFRIKELDAKAD